MTNEEYNKKLLGAIFRIHAAAQNTSQSLTERSILLRDMKDVINSDLSRAHEMLIELDDSLKIPTPQESPWIKIEQGCELPEEMGEVILLDVYPRSSSCYKATFCKELKSFLLDGYADIDLDEIYADKSCQHYYMPIPPLPGDEK